MIVVSLGKNGQEELVKNRRASKELVAYLGESIGLSGKDMGSILNTSDSGISNLKKKTKK